MPGTGEGAGLLDVSPPGAGGFVLPPELLDRLAGLFNPDNNGGGGAGLGRIGDQSSRAADVRVVLLVPWATLAGGDRPGVLAGHGPLPAPLVRELIATGVGRVWFRAQAPPDPSLVSRSRTFRGRLREQIEDRDQRCRDPYCAAPIRHIDHIRRRADGGPTSYLNGRGVCEHGNYLRELPGWDVRLIDPDSHTVQLTTPTGHHYTSQPPQPP